MDSAAAAAALRTVDHLSALVAYWDTNARCVFANAAYSQRLGFGPKEMIGMSIEEFLGPKYEVSRPFILGALRGERQTFEQQIRKSGGGVMDALVTYAPDFGDDGSVVGFTAHIMDVSVLRDRESALAEALRQLKRLGRIYEALHNCTAAIAHCSTEQELLTEVCRVAVADGGMKLAWVGLVDPASQELRAVAWSGEPGDYVPTIRISIRPGDIFSTGPTGTSIRERRPIYCQDFLADAANKPWRDDVTRAGLAASASLPLYRDGAAIGALTLYTAERDAFDEDIQRLLVAMGADISLALDNFARAAALAASEARYRALAEWSPQPTLVIRDGVVIYANPAAVEMFGARPAGGLVGVHVLDRVHPDSRALAVDRLKALADGARGTPLLEYRYMRLDGTPIDAEVQSVVIEFDGAPAVQVVMRDVTAHRVSEAERASLAAQLEQAQKMESVGRLAGGVAHDFNNMLGVILGHAELAMRHTDASDAQYADLEEIRNAAERSADLTKQLLTFARQQVVDPQVLDLNESVAHALRMLQRMIGEDIAMNWLPQARLWPVYLDPSQLDQILINLCVNARDAISDVGTITLTTANTVVAENHDAAGAVAMPGDYVRLTVSDDGCGMDRNTLDRIFEPFYTTKPIGEGTGLGLSTVYGAVKQNRGAIAVSSTPGEGTSFDVYLPRYSGAATRANDARHETSPAARGRETVLVVEDEPSLLRLTTLVLEAQGYSVLATATPGEALRVAAAREGNVDLLLTDVVMPEMNGRELVRQLVERHPKVKHLFMSGYPADVIGKHGVLAKGVHLIQKPFSLKELATKVREVLDQS